MSRYIIRKIRTAHCKRGPERCVKCKEMNVEKQIARAIEKTLLNRAGKANDIAKAVRFLIEDGDYITGLILSVDGGRSIK